jgi:hypothetical protein
MYNMHMLFFKNWLIFFFDDIFSYIPEESIPNAVRFITYLIKPFKYVRIYALYKKLIRHRYPTLRISGLKKKIIRSLRSRNYFSNNKSQLRFSDYNKYSLSLFFMSLYQMTYDQVRLLYISFKDEFHLSTFNQLFTLLNRKVDIFFKNYYSLSDLELDSIFRLKKLYLNDRAIVSRD